MKKKLNLNSPEFANGGLLSKNELKNILGGTRMGCKFRNQDCLADQDCCPGLICHSSANKCVPKVCNTGNCTIEVPGQGTKAGYCDLRSGSCACISSDDILIWEGNPECNI